MWWLIQRLASWTPTHLFYGDDGSACKTPIIQPLQEANPILINRIRQRIAVAKIEGAWLSHKRRCTTAAACARFDEILKERIEYWTRTTVSL